MISNVEGAAATVACPWCEGGGVRLGEIDAQARWRAEGTTPQDAPGETPDSAA